MNIQLKIYPVIFKVAYRYMVIKHLLLLSSSISQALLKDKLIATIGLF
jgi:hypothetical protein